jgi:hypothetical protein
LLRIISLYSLLLILENIKGGCICMELECINDMKNTTSLIEMTNRCKVVLHRRPMRIHHIAIYKPILWLYLQNNCKMLNFQ